MAGHAVAEAERSDCIVGDKGKVISSFPLVLMETVATVHGAFSTVSSPPLLPAPLQTTKKGYTNQVESVMMPPKLLSEKFQMGMQ